MSQYRYRATDEAGNAYEDVLEADSSRQVVASLREAGLIVSSVKEVNTPRGFRIAKPLSWSELHQFVQQLHAITHSQLPLPAALKTLAADLRSPRLAFVLKTLRKDIEQGVSLDDALARQRNTFPPHFVDIVRAGQAAGNLSKVLLVYLRFTERMMNINYVLKGALAYPLMVVLVACLVLAAMVVYVIPVYWQIFREFNAVPPDYMAFALIVGNFIADDWRYLLLSGIALCVLLYLAKRMIVRTDRGEVVFDWVYLHVPVLGVLRQKSMLIRFSRTLALLLESRVPLSESFELAACAADSALLRRAVRRATPRALGGERIADAFAETRFFPYHFCWLLAVGEDRGDVESALNDVSESMERELGYHDKILGAVLEPALILALGLMLSGFVFSMYAPLYWFSFSIE